MNPQRVDAALALVSPAADATLPGFTGRAAFGETTQIADLALAASAPTGQFGLSSTYETSANALYGRVIDASTGEGVTGAEIVVSFASGPPQTYVTLPGGGFGFDSVSFGAFTGTVRALDYSGATFSGSLLPEHAGILEDVVLTPIPRAAGAEIARAPSGPTLTGRVLDAQSQASVARADVIVDVGGQSEQGYANAQGIYLLPVATGTLTGSIAASGYTGATLSGTTTSGQTRMADALLTTSGPAVAVGSAGSSLTAAVVIGHVTDAQTGAGISGALVTLVVNGQTLIGLSDANGDFRFEVEPGSVTGTIVATGYGTSTFTVTLAAGDTVNVNVASNPPVLPPTGLPGLMNEVDILVPPPGTVTDWEKVTVVGTVLRPSSQVTVNGVAATVVGNRFTAKHIDLAMGANTITATATNVGSPAAAKTISVERSTTPVLAVTIYSPPEGATVPGSGLVVRGFVSAVRSSISGAGSYALPEEGVFTIVDAEVPVGSTTVSVFAEALDGGGVARSAVPVLVNSADPALLLEATPSSGVAPLFANLSLRLGVPSFPIERLDFDSDGDREPDLIGVASPSISVSFTTPRLSRPRAYATLPNGAELSAEAFINAHLPPVVLSTFATGNPVDLASGPDRGVYVLDQDAARISLFDASGSLVRIIGSSGAGSGQLSRPEGLAVAVSGEIFVADTGNDRIQVFSPDGQALRSIGARGTSIGAFNRPTSVAVDGDTLFVSDTGNARIQLLKLDGSPAAHPDLSLLAPRGLDSGSRFGLLIASPMRGLSSFDGLLLEPAKPLQPASMGDSVTAAVDVASASDAIWVASASEGALHLYDQRLLFRQRVETGTRPLAVLPSERREAESVFVADGQKVIEVSTNLPSPLGVVSMLRDRLIAGDVPGLLELIHPVERDRLARTYTERSSALASDGADMSNLRVDLLRPDRSIVRFDAPIDGPNGTNMESFPVILTREQDGSWWIVDY